MSLPTITEFENMDLKEALKVLRIYIRNVTTPSLKRDRDKIESAIAALRKRNHCQESVDRQPIQICKLLNKA